MDYVVNSFDITKTNDYIFMRFNDIQNVQFQKINLRMNEKLTLSTRRARRRFFTRTTGVLRRRDFLTRWRNSGKARLSTRSRRTTRSLTILSDQTLNDSRSSPEVTLMNCLILSQLLLTSLILYRSKALQRERYRRSSRGQA